MFLRFLSIRRLSLNLIEYSYMDPYKSVVTRFAPSPTGQMHVGGIRTALYAYLWAKKNKGTFILRIEDTDKEREVAGSQEHIIAALGWLGLGYDEGPDIGGPHAPYIQSQRLDIYKKYADILIEKGFAYADPYSQEELEALRVKAEAEKRPFLYRDHRPENPPAWDGSMPLRFKTPIKPYAWTDVVRGELSTGVEAVDDIVLIKSDGYPTYNFAHLVDDIEMGVSIVCRGEEFISSTPKYLAIYEAFGIVPPLYATLPPILGPGGGKKLSKRDGAKDVLEYGEEGYLPDAVVNFLVLLGWNPGDDREIFSREELIEAFDISRVQRSGAQLNIEKLNWINREHMKRLSLEEQEKHIAAFLPESITSAPEFSTDMLHTIVPIVMERIEKFSDVRTMAEAGELGFFFSTPTLDLEKISFKGIEKTETKLHLEKVLEILTGISSTDWNNDGIKVAVMAYADTLPKRGPALHPLRYSLSGLERSPDPFTIASIIGREKTLARVTAAIGVL